MARTHSATFAAFPLRVALGLTFLWAGLGKLDATMPVQGDDAALLATMGVQRVRDVAPPARTTRPASASPAGAGEEGKPDAVTEPVKPEPAQPEPAQPEPVEPEEGRAPEAGPPLPTDVPKGEGEGEGAQPSDAQPADEQRDDAQRKDQVPEGRAGAAGERASDARGALRAHGAGLVLAQVTAPSASSGAGQPSADRVYVAAEFPDAVQVPRVYGLALLLHKAGFPQGMKQAPGVQEGNVSPPAESKQDVMALWPQRLASGAWPVRLAWTVAVTEVVAGLFVLVGLLTRVSAIALAGTMLGAIWLTEVGPALQSGSTVLGFLPDRPRYDIGAWRGLAWQFALLCACASLAMLGGGRLSFDRKLFPPDPPAPARPRALV